MKRLFAAFIVILWSVGLAAAQDNPPSPKQVFFDDRTVNAATDEILKMDYAELKQVSTVLAACAGDSETSDISVYQCHFTASQYDIEYGQDRPLDHLLFARNVTAEYMRASGRAHSVTPETTDMTKRFVQIDFLLARAMKLRFQALRIKSAEKP